MDRETIIKAISDPTLVRRAFAAIREDPGPLKLVTSRTGSEDLNHNTTNTLTPPPSHFPHGERGFQCGQLIQKKDGRKD